MLTIQCLSTFKIRLYQIIAQIVKPIRLMHESAMISGCLVVVPTLGSGM